ncbi:DUF3784 domain-containing protein [Granulicatella seriolae]|uniref:DUF3784 domain-containing protein n=1 Tax=Granulicatella seriolae TaxID=2967226 RepID=A0ABT1WMW4_9LACT|nr:DUF3784 domain-containing protein [Granulicatella seriolae]
MFLASLLSGLTLLFIGIIIWRFKLVNILAGYKSSETSNPNRLATLVGISLMLNGVVILVEAMLIYEEILANETALLTIIGTLLIGVSITGLVANYFSKR